MLPYNYIPDFLVRLQGEGRDARPLGEGGQDEWKDLKAPGARQRMKAVNEDDGYGRWEYTVVRDCSKAANAAAETVKPLALLDPMEEGT